MVVAELGPGRGTLLADALRAWRSVPPLRRMRLRRAHRDEPRAARGAKKRRCARSHAPIQWCETIEDVPQGRPLIVLANEFIDALPVRQLVRRDGVWRERCVGIEPTRRLRLRRR